VEKEVKREKKVLKEVKRELLRRCSNSETPAGAMR